MICFLKLPLNVVPSENDLGSSQQDHPDYPSKLNCIYLLCRISCSLPSLQ